MAGSWRQTSNHLDAADQCFHIHLVWTSQGKVAVCNLAVTAVDVAVGEPACKLCAGDRFDCNGDLGQGA